MGITPRKQESDSTGSSEPLAASRLAAHWDLGPLPVAVASGLAPSGRALDSCSRLYHSASNATISNSDCRGPNAPDNRRSNPQLAPTRPSGLHDPPEQTPCE